MALVPVKTPFVLLVLSGACNPARAWRLAGGARVSPFEQNNILHQVRDLRWRVIVARLFLWDVVTLPFDLWRKV